MTVIWKLNPHLKNTLLSKLYNNGICIKVALDAYEE